MAILSATRDIILRTEQKSKLVLCHQVLFTDPDLHRLPSVSSTLRLTSAISTRTASQSNPVQLARAEQGSKHPTFLQLYLHYQVGGRCTVGTVQYSTACHGNFPRVLGLRVFPLSGLCLSFQQLASFDEERYFDSLPLTSLGDLDLDLHWDLPYTTLRLIVPLYRSSEIPASASDKPHNYCSTWLPIAIVINVIAVPQSSATIPGRTHIPSLPRYVPKVTVNLQGTSSLHTRPRSLST
jgi:hypothetical protein